MPVTLEELKASPLWDPRYNLPLSPRYDNPHLYCAYAVKAFGHEYMPEYGSFLRDCYHGRLYDKWPHNKTDFTSHDELVGIAYNSSQYIIICGVIENEILFTLRNNSGFYDNTGKIGRTWKTWVYRFYWLVPYLRARAHWFVFPWHDLLWAINCLSDAYFNDGGVSGSLMIWLMSDEMERHFFSRFAIRIWRKKRPSPKEMFAAYFNKPDEVIWQKAFE